MCNCNIKFNFRQVGSDTEMQAVCCGCKGPWSVMPSSSGAGLYLPLAGGTMNPNAVINLQSGNLQSTLSTNGWQYQDTSVGGVINIGFDALNMLSNNVYFSPIPGRVMINNGVQQANADVVYAAGKQALLADDSGGNIVVTLPRFPLNEYPFGTIYRIKKMSASANTVEIVGQLGSIENSSSIFLTTQYESVTIVRVDINDWVIV